MTSFVIVKPFSLRMDWAEDLDRSSSPKVEKVIS